MCGAKGYGFLAVLVWDRVSISTILVWNRVWFLHSSLELGMFFRRSYFIIWRQDHFNVYANRVRAVTACQVLRSRAVHIWFISYIINTHFFRAKIWTHNWPAHNVTGFIAQLVEHRPGNREVMGSNPVEVLNFFSGFFTQLHKLRSLRRSFLHFHFISAVHIWFISYIINTYRVFSHDVTAAIWVSQNNETAAMLVSQTNPLGVELFSYANAFFCSNKFAWLLTTWVKTLYRKPSRAIKITV